MHGTRHDTAETIVRLAPAYDVICILVYPTIPDELSLVFGGVEHASAMNTAVLVKAARVQPPTRPRLLG